MDSFKSSMICRSSSSSIIFLFVKGTFDAFITKLSKSSNNLSEFMSSTPTPDIYL